MSGNQLVVSYPNRCRTSIGSALLMVVLALLAVTVGCSSTALPPDDGNSLCAEDQECSWGSYCDDGVCQQADILCDESGSCADGYSCRNGGCVLSGSDGGDAGDGGDGGDGGEPRPEPDIQVDEPPLTGDPPGYQLNFGNVLVGETVSRSVVFSNVGSAELQVVQLNFEAGGGAEDFSVPQQQLDALPLVLAPGEQATIDVLYTASDGLTDSAILDIISNDPDEALVQIHLLSEFKGLALAVVSPAALDFGDVPVGQNSQPLSFSVLNQGSGNAALLVEDIRMGILANPDFSLLVRDAVGQEASLPVYVNNGDFLEVEVTYHPQAREADSDEVVVISDDQSNPSLSVSLSGRGVLGDLAVDPSPADLGRVRVGEHGELLVTLSNSGGAPFDLTSVALADVSGEWILSSTDLDLADLPNNPRRLAPAESVTVLLGFDPLDTGLETGSLVIDNTTETPQRLVAVQAEGFIPPAVEVQPDPPALLFGNVQLDFGSGQSDSKTLDVIIRNTGGEPLEISSVQRASMTSPEFTFSPDTFVPVPAGEQVTLSVTFTPMDLGSENGSLLVDTNDPDISLDSVPGRFRIDLAASGIDPNLFISPAGGLDFDDIYVGRRVEQQVSLRNAGTGPLEISEIRMSAGSSVDFELVDLPALPLTISSTAIEVTFKVAYTPDVIGPDLGAVEIFSSDMGAEQPTVLPLSGNGAGCPAGTIDCNGDPQDGCERPCIPTGAETCNYLDDDCDCDTDEDFDLQNDPVNCGTCNNVCSYPFGVAGCVNGNCEMQRCLDGYADCNLTDQDGCEIHTDADVANCGSCNNACQFDHADASCLSGFCIMGSCDTGWRDCDYSDTNGCETDIYFDEQNCGGCGNRCLYQNGEGICSGGNCFLSSCLPGYDDCNNNRGDGCEVDLNTDVNNCGFCFNQCPGTVGTPICDNGSCDISSCNPGLEDCDPNDGVQCETDIWSDPNNCNGCGLVCSLDHASALCSTGSCVVDQCDSGWGDCNNQDPDGCERDVTSDPNNCGFCGNVCSFDNASAACVDSNCQLDSCDAGYYNINGDPGDGCECLADGVADICDDGTITDLGTLGDGAVEQVAGNLIPADDEDWYTFTAPDNNTEDINSGSDQYHLRISFASNPGNQYAFYVYRNANVSAGCAQKGTPVCPGADIEYEHYFYNECSPILPEACRGSTSGPGDCGCANNTARYWLRVVRAGTGVSCDNYQIYIEFTQ